MKNTPPLFPASLILQPLSAIIISPIEQHFNIVMKAAAGTLVFLLIIVSATAQSNNKEIFVGNVISDISTFRENNYTALPPILESKNKIEIRFIDCTSFKRASYLVISYSKKWTAKYYFYDELKDTLLPKEIVKIKLDTIFSQLVKNNIFSLPDNDSLKPEKYIYNLETNELLGEGMIVDDGTRYWIEFKVGDCFRRYKYENPSDYADFYTNVPELRNFVNIVLILGDLMKE